MQGQYAPLAMLNQFTSGITNTAMNNASANTRTAMQLSAQAELEAKRAKIQQKQFEMSYGLQQESEGAKANYYKYVGGGKDAAELEKLGSLASGKLMSRMGDLQMLLTQLPPNDPRRKIVMEQMTMLKAGLGLAPGERSGFAGTLGSFLDNPSTAALFADAYGNKAKVPAKPGSNSAVLPADAPPGSTLQFNPGDDNPDSAANMEWHFAGGRGTSPYANGVSWTEVPDEENYQSLIDERNAAWVDPELGGSEPAPSASSGSRNPRQQTSTASPSSEAGTGGGTGGGRNPKQGR